MMKNVHEKTKGNCCSCHVCSLKCPKNCIEMTEDEKGFKYPAVDLSKCVDCGVCLRSCPFDDTGKLDNSYQKCYSLVANDVEVISRSTSGGAFLSLSKSFFDIGAGTVYGVTMTDGFRVEYAVASTLQECVKFCRSKYVRANAETVYPDVQSDLREGNRVLFVGTPCSVAALKKYLAKEYEGLYTVDFVCHGTPSPKEFYEYLRSEGSVSKYEFRYDDGHSNANSLITYEDGSKKVASPASDIYLRAYYAGLLQMDGCFNCPWSDIKRVSDITLGDFWGIEKHNTELQSGRGISLVLVNSQKGYGLMERVSDAVITRYSTEVAVNGNPQLERPCAKHPQRDRFVALMNSKGFRKAVLKVLGRPKGVPLSLKLKHAVKMLLIKVFRIK